MNEIYTQMEAFPDKPEEIPPKEEVTSIANVAPEVIPVEPLPRINTIRAKYVLEAEEELKKELDGEPFSHMDVATRAAKKWLEVNAILAHPPDKVKTEDEMLSTYEQYLIIKEKYPAETLDLILHGKPKEEPKAPPRKTRVKRAPRESWTARLEREQNEREEKRKELLGIPDLVQESE